MVEVLISENGNVICRWEFSFHFTAISIQRDGNILGYISEAIPDSQKLLDIALEAICNDIKTAIQREKSVKK